jgi:uncharacterized membrane protein
MTRVRRDAPRPIGRYRLAAGIWMSALLALAAAPASAQSRSGQQRAIDIAVTDLGLPGTFRVLINDRGLVFGTDDSTGANFVLDTRTGAFDGSVPSFDPVDINKRGEVVGIFDAPRSAGGTQGALWTKEDGRRLSSTFLARGINKHGDMAGNCIVGIDQVGPPCVLIRGRHDDHGSDVIHVIDVDADSAALVAINDHRVAVGNASNADGSQRAFTWSFTDGVRLLEAPPSTSRFATAINNHGLIAGAIQGENVSHPTMWSAGSGRIAATLTALSGLALAINDHGVLLVNALNHQTGQFEYDVWVPRRRIVAVLRPEDPTATGVVASDINNRGGIIGSQYHATPDGIVLSTELIMWQIAIRGAHR